MMCVPPGFSVTGSLAGTSTPARGRIFMTPPSIVIECKPAFFAAGLDTETRRSALGDTIVT